MAFGAEWWLLCSNQYFTSVSENECYSYSCRCGGEFHLEKEEAEEDEDSVVCCDTCSLSIEVRRSTWCLLIKLSSAFHRLLEWAEKLMANNVSCIFSKQSVLSISWRLSLMANFEDGEDTNITLYLDFWFMTFWFCCHQRACAYLFMVSNNVTWTCLIYN